MFEKLEILQMAGAMAANAGNRQAAVSQNIANADTPGYKAVDVASFAQTYRGPTGFVASATRPGHFGFGENTGPVAASATQQRGAQNPNGNTVSLEGEMMKAGLIRQQHDMALAIYKSTSNILRASLGRR